MESNVQARPLLVNSKEASRLLGISCSQFMKLNRQQKIPRAVFLGRKAPRWKERELCDWLEHDCPDRATWEQIKSEKGDAA